MEQATLLCPLCGDFNTHQVAARVGFRRTEDEETSPIFSINTEALPRPPRGEPTPATVEIDKIMSDLRKGVPEQPYSDPWAGRTYPGERSPRCSVRTQTTEGHIRGRRHEIQIDIECECCGGTSTLTIQQHKGCTNIAWLDGSDLQLD